MFILKFIECKRTRFKFITTDAVDDALYRCLRKCVMGATRMRNEMETTALKRSRGVTKLLLSSELCN